LKRIYESSWAIIKNHCMMHGQQNVKFCVLSDLAKVPEFGFLYIRS